MNDHASDRHALDRRALGRALSRIANASVAEVVAMIDNMPVRRARRIGLTGPPGVGKSSLCGRIAVQRLQRGRIGVLAIDPSSPRSGGAILGDRIRIDELESAGDLFVRSLASRSMDNGLSDNLPELLAVMDEHHFDEIIVETVGVGQAEYAARSEVDTLVLIVIPETGDVIQAMKAGIMELADIYVVNKADLAGAPKIASEIKRILNFTANGREGWMPPVLLTSIQDAASIDRLSIEIDRHQAWLQQAGLDQRRRIERARYRLRSLLARQAVELVAGLPDHFFDQAFRLQYDGALESIRSTQSAVPSRESPAV